jgi:hypothetical protein
MTEERTFCDLLGLQRFLFLNFSSERFYSCLMAQQRTVQTVNSQFVKDSFVLAFLFVVNGSRIITPTLQHANWNVSFDARLTRFASATSVFLKY